MVESKTLKDIYEIALKREFTPEQLIAITWFYNNSIAEAIKWIKNYKKINNIDWLDFFNITEYDLKDLEDESVKNRYIKSYDLGG